MSYSHRQGEWVHDALVPVLRASGADVLIDLKRFKAGSAVVGQMDATQDKADRHVLVVTSDYLNSGYCQHEMDRAIQSDPAFPSGRVIPVRFDSAKLPDTFDDVIHVDLRDADASEQWWRLIEQAGGELGMSAPAWLAALDKAARHLERNESVNVVVQGDVDWRAWLEELRANRFPKLAIVDLDNPVAVPRDGLISEVLRTAGRSRVVPRPPNDLPELALGLGGGARSYVALTHFDRVAERPQYESDLFSSLRFLVMDKRQLVLLVQTRQPVETLLPLGSLGHQLSRINFKTVELGDQAAR